MDNHQKHIIKKIVTDVVCDRLTYESIRDFDWRGLIELIIKTLEAYFDRIGTNKTIRIDKLTLNIDVDVSSINELERIITQAFIEEISKIEALVHDNLSVNRLNNESIINKHFNRKVSEKDFPESSSNEAFKDKSSKERFKEKPSKECLRDKSSTGQSKSQTPEPHKSEAPFEEQMTKPLDTENTREVSGLKILKGASAMQLKDLLYYFKTGHLPWYQSKVDLAWIDLIEHQLFGQLKLLFKSDFRIIERFVYQQPLEDILAFSEQIFSRQAFQRIADWHQNIKLIASKYSEKYDVVYRTTSMMYIALYKSISELSDDRNERHEIEASFYKYFKSGIQAYFEEHTDQVLFELTNQQTVHQVDPVKLESASFELTKLDKERNEIQVLNAGIVLLHPFLSTFFKKLGLVENGQFQNLDCQQRAINLLHFLATGSEQCDEHDAVLYKLICNVPIDQSFPKHLPISPFEKQEAESLLKSAVKHWTVLKNTSIGGLRANFIMRKGVLEEDTTDLYILYVESAAADILLDKLPWGLSLIKFPWAPHFLTVKWR